LDQISPYQQQLPIKVKENNKANHINYPPNMPNNKNHYNHVKILQDGIQKTLNLHNSRGPKFDLKTNGRHQSGLKYNTQQRLYQSPQRTHVYGIARQTNG
jgi:thiol:disulfide interchange protein